MFRPLCKFNSYHDVFFTCTLLRRALRFRAGKGKLLQSTHHIMGYSGVLDLPWPVLSIWALNLECNCEKKYFSYKAIGASILPSKSCRWLTMACHAAVNGGTFRPTQPNKWQHLNSTQQCKRWCCYCIQNYSGGLSSLSNWVLKIPLGDNVDLFPLPFSSCHRALI